MTPLDCLDLYEDAELYDAEFAARDLDIPFFRKHARRAGGPVLEVACGTARITLPIARDGVDMTGLDVSRPMLEQARRKAAAEALNIEWIEHDCRAMHLALIFSATNAMQHLLDFESASAFLQSARDLLASGGQLIWMSSIQTSRNSLAPPLRAICTKRSQCQTVRASASKLPASITPTRRFCISISSISAANNSSAPRA